MTDVIVKDNIENLIYEIRGKQVMLDSDLARLYECKNGTKEINQAVKNNIEKFPERFSWILTDEESTNFLVKNFDQKLETRGGRYKKPRVFTEQGVMMLATILKSKIATETTIRIMDAFVEMKKYFSNNLLEQKYINNLVLEDHDKIKILQESFDKLSEKTKDTKIYFAGQMYDAYSKILNIFKSAKKELIIIDSYADNVILDIVKRLKTKVTIITKSNNLLTRLDIEKYNTQYHNLKVIFDNSFHDRYFIIDNKEFYHCGTSINRIGYKTFSITRMNDEETYIELLNKVNKLINKKEEQYA